MDRPPRLVEMTPDRIHGLRKAEAAHKYDHGHVFVLSGGPGATGAARLAARGALRVGAGLVTLGVPPAAQSEVAAQETAVMLRRIANPGGLASFLEDGRINVLCLGPGLGVARAAPLLAAALSATRRGLVIDADALTAIAGDSGLMDALHPGCLLTPHMGEFGRLFPDIDMPEGQDDDAIRDRAAALRVAAARAGCTILLKGAATLIAAPDGVCHLSDARGDRAAPWLATAGAGDVLAGIAAGVMARGQGPSLAGQNAAWLHAEAARMFGPGLIAEDLPDLLPRVFARLGV